MTTPHLPPNILIFDRRSKQLYRISDLEGPYDNNGVPQYDIPNLVPCEECDGTGEIWKFCKCHVNSNQYDCPACGNAGVVDSWQCPACDGDGVVEAEEE